MAKVIYTKRGAVRITLEKVLSLICFIAGVAFLIVAIMGTWRYYITMGLCFAIGVMISDELPEEDEKKERH